MKSQSNSVRQAIRSFQCDVSAETVKQIERGLPPYDAAVKAREIVSRRRHNQAKRKAANDGK